MCDPEKFKHLLDMNNSLLDSGQKLLEANESLKKANTDLRNALDKRIEINNMLDEERNSLLILLRSIYELDSDVGFSEVYDILDPLFRKNNLTLN